MTIRNFKNTTMKNKMKNLKNATIELNAGKVLDSLSHTVWYGFPELPNVEADIVSFATDSTPATMMLFGMALNALGVESEMEEVGTDNANGGLDIDIHYHVAITKAQWEELKK